jgi:acetoacetyl-CoA synthetase
MPSNAIRTPSDLDVRRARITAFQNWLRERRDLRFSDYESLWRWSVSDLDAFWDSIREFFDLRLNGEWSRVVADRSMPGAIWYPGASLNYVAQVFRHRTAECPAIVYANEEGSVGEVAWAQLERDVGALAGWLRDRGVKSGDRVVGYLPNIPEAVTAFLAAASIGAIWSMCSPDMGVASVLDRFRQIEPKVLLTVGGYVNAGRRVDRAFEVEKLVAELSTLEQVVWVPGFGNPPPAPRRARVTQWATVMMEQASLDPESLVFDHPLWIVYSSGTTGLPKAIVHSHGGIVFEHVKTHALHFDLNPTDRFFWYSSTGWIMWNLQVSGLLVGSTICLFNGSPAGPDSTRPDLNTLWSFAARAGATFFGGGAAYFASCHKAGIEPSRTVDVSRIRSIGTTGSPLSPETEEWLYQAVGHNVWVAAVSGGTDFASGFVGGVPTVPSYLGEMQARCLGASVEAWSDSGISLLDEVGELVCTAPMPSMPLRFWNDPGNRRYLESYFDTYPGIWRHGDWIRLVPHPDASGAVIYGRSDATINRHGIRTGTAEFYRAVELLPEIMDSLVVDLEFLGRESYMPLFVVLRPGFVLDDALKARINAAVRTALSPRHVPNEIIPVADVPRTMSGKKLELPVKKLMLGQPADKVLNRDAMANPESIDWYIEFARAYAGRGP